MGLTANCICVTIVYQFVKGVKMSGWNTILTIRRLEAELKKIGLVMGGSKLSNYQQGIDLITLYPDADSLPIFARNAEIFTGTVRDIEIWLHGFNQARDYDRMLLGSGNDEKRKRKELNYRNQQLLNKIKVSDTR